MRKVPGRPSLGRRPDRRRRASAAALRSQVLLSQADAGIAAVAIGLSACADVPHSNEWLVAALPLIPGGINSWRSFLWWQMAVLAMGVLVSVVLLLTPEGVQVFPSDCAA